MLTFLLALGLAHAQQKGPMGLVSANRDQLWYDNAFFARYNPLGLIDNFRIGYRRRLEIGNTALGRDAYVFAGAWITASPAFARGGVFVDIEPTALFRFAANYQYGGFFGTFDQVASFDGPGRAWSDTDIARLGEAGQTAPTTGHHVALLAQPKFAFGPFAMRNTLTVLWSDLDLPEGDRAWYDQIYDRVVPDGGVYLANDLDVMGLVSKARFGVRYTYSNSYFAPDDPGPAADPHHRLGPLFAWQFHNHKDRARFDRPTLFVLAQWWLAHPYRTGEDVHQGIPVVAVGLAFEGDLLWKGPPGGKKQRARKGKR